MTAIQPSARPQGGSMPPATAVPADDAALIDAWQRWTAMHGRVVAYMDKWGGTIEGERRSYPALCAMENRLIRIEAEILAALPPRTKEGALQVAASAHEFLTWNGHGLHNADDFLTETVLGCLSVLADLPAL